MLNGIQPVGYKILIKPDEVAEEVTESGIVITAVDKEKYQQAQVTGVVVSKGSDAYSEEGTHWVDIGDRIIYDKYTGMSVNGEDGTEYRLINDTQAQAVISDQIKLGYLERRVQYER